MSTLEQLTILKTPLEKMEFRRLALNRSLEASIKLHDQLRRQIVELVKEADSLLRVEGGFTKIERGEIVDLRKKLEKLDLQIEDEQKPLVYWSKYSGTEQDTSTPTPTYINKPIDTPYVVDKVTKKRIFIRRKGVNEGVGQFEYDGTNVGSYKRDQIDIAKTFPEGLKPS